MSYFLPWEPDQADGSLARRVAAHAAQRIVERSIPAGHLLTEAELSLEMGVSRTPSREAMLQLARWGLVRLMPKKGAVVTAITFEERRDLLATRGLFERGALESLTSTPGKLTELSSSLNQPLQAQRAAIASGDLLGFASADFAFHAALVQAGGNNVLTDLLTELAPRLARLTFEAALEHPEQLATYLQEHERLADLAGQANATEFAQCLNAHLTKAHFPKKAN